MSVMPAMPANNTVGLAWDDQDCIVRVNMTWNIINTDGHGILDTYTAANIWSILNTKYERTGIQLQTVLLDCLYMKKYEDSSSLIEHIIDLDHHKTLVNHAGANIIEEYIQCTSVMMVSDYH
jgi:gag-polypeptide of LTR copia-type